MASKGAKTAGEGLSSDKFLFIETEPIDSLALLLGKMDDRSHIWKYYAEHKRSVGRVVKLYSAKGKKQALASLYTKVALECINKCSAWFY